MIPLPLSAQQTQLNIAAASDLKFPLTDLAAVYEKQSGVKLNLTFGSSGNFFAQIQNGAPFDVFFSADSDYPRKLSDAGLVLPNGTHQYAVGHIVIWVPADSKLSADIGWQVLLDPAVRKIAIANPNHAPYGAAAIGALKKSGYYDRVKDKLVFGEDVSQAAQFVQSGNAQVGIVALSLALSPSLSNGRHWRIPQNQYLRMTQTAVILKSTNQKDQALAFLKFLNTEGRKTLEQYGFERPSSVPLLEPNNR